MEIKLNTAIEEIPGAQQRFIPKLKKLGIKTVWDLLMHFPTRYEDWREVVQISDLAPGDEKTIQGTIQEVKQTRTWQKRMIVTEALIGDETGSIRAVWFNQPYIGKMLEKGKLINISGKISKPKSKGAPYFSNPNYELIPKGHSEPKHTARIVSIYPETRGLTSKGIRFIMKNVLDSVEEIPEFIPEEILKKLKLSEINDAIHKIHLPEDIDEAEKAKKRFAFQDLFLLRLKNSLERLSLQKQDAPAVKYSEKSLKEIFSKLPFEFTGDQTKALQEILDDISEPHPMNRLLQGDVGSGKTIVAGVSAILSASPPNSLQTAFMAPTEILARQHYKTLTKLFNEFTGGIGLLVAKEARIFFGDELEEKTTKADMVKKVATGKLKIIIGTHALIQKNVEFENLGLVVIDEQHRFGVKQRARLLTRGKTQKKTQTNAENKLLYKDLTYKIRGTAFEVKKQLGLGHKESIYQKALAEELTRLDINFEKEKAINLSYKGKKIGTYQPDFIIDSKVLVELKALAYVGEPHQKQLWSYLKGSSYKLALLINFGTKELQIKRIVYDTARTQRGSVSSRRKSALEPHFLSMSATPIPRTLMMTVFGNLDISLITELPKGRREIITKIVDPENRDKAYAFIRGEVRKGRQVYVVCPRIETPAQNDAEDTQTNAEIPRGSLPAGKQARFSPRQSALESWDNVKAVEEEYEKLSKHVFPDLEVAMLHGKLKSQEKDSVMTEFSQGKSDLLVSTSVIEVGVDVPNATIMMIESADRFGLAQLYQFRGRVGRGEHQSFCFLFTESHTKTSHNRLESLLTAKNSFELAEKDLEIRGPGELLGQEQSGMPDIAMTAIQNPKLLKSAQEIAEDIIKNDPELKNHPELKKRLDEFGEEIHLE